ncbi:hypothetical protein [Frondihabitans sp. Leaf304]|uniref:hypothetical protein n=1 Tax=Frondihabitans sp. Leaf304 TaxID=1736329 RepID=UPI0012FAD5BA|nr:hypothetical protein [Frondihabitans sp. Leaf304]
MPSLIQRRMAIDRQRLSGLYFVTGSVVFIVLCGLNVVDHRLNGFVIGQGLIGVAWLIIGLVTRRRARKAMVAFESAEGVGAGVQPPRTPREQNQHD